MKPRLLDLFCGAGGAAVGYYRAGFDIIGVDNKPQPNYPFEFHLADALEYPLDGFDAYHASPPCQRYSRTKAMHNSEHPDYYKTIREKLISTGKPWVIENVIGAPYQSGITLCGSMFGLGVWRHRNFETSWLIWQPLCGHDLVPYPIDVTGTGGPCDRLDKSTGGAHRKPQNIAHAREVMGIDWMTRRDISQAIPPAYTKYIGDKLMEILGGPNPPPLPNPLKAQ